MSHDLPPDDLPPPEHEEVLPPGVHRLACPACGGALYVMADGPEYALRWCVGGCSEGQIDAGWAALDEQERAWTCL